MAASKNITNMDSLLDHLEMTQEKYIYKIDNILLSEDSEDQLIKLINENPKITMWFGYHIPPIAVTEKVFLESSYVKLVGFHSFSKLEQTEKMCLHYLNTIPNVVSSCLNLEQIVKIRTPAVIKELNRKKLLYSGDY